MRSNGAFGKSIQRPTAKQLIKLYVIEVIGSTKRVIVDDASVNYHQTGMYTIRFLIEEIHRSGEHKIQLIGRDRSGNETFIPVQVDVLEHAWIISGQRGDSKNTYKLFKTKMITAEVNHHTTTVKTTDTPILPIKKWLPIGVFLLLIGMLVFLRMQRVFRKNTFFHRRTLK